MCFHVYWEITDENSFTLCTEQPAKHQCANVQTVFDQGDRKIAEKVRPLGDIGETVSTSQAWFPFRKKNIPNCQ